MNKMLMLINGLLVFLISASAFSQSYVTISYVNNQWGTPLEIRKIDLNSREEIASRSIPIYGELITKVPIYLRMGRQPILVLISINGVACKNCQVSRPSTSYAILDTSFNIIRLDSLLDMGIYEHLDMRADSLVLEYFKQIDDSSFSEKAAFILSNRGILSRARALNFDYRPDNFLRIANFSNISPLNNPFYSIYWDVDDSFDVYFLKINLNGNQITSSLSVGDFISYSKIFGISPIDSMLYVFSLSYDIPHISGPLATRNNRQSYLKKYNSTDFSLVDSIPIPNIESDTDYVRNELGPCEIAGPFMVYYFFKSDDYRYFSPAMLFIFDTRTNQATWLRVGWR
jgi:hypothetical protein